jgi:hypothetical protein
LAGRIYDCDSIPVANPDITGLLIASDVVGVITKLQRFLQSWRLSIIDPKLAVSSCGNIKPAGFRIIVDAMGLFEPFNFCSTFERKFIDSCFILPMFVCLFWSERKCSPPGPIKNLRIETIVFVHRNGFIPATGHRNDNSQRHEQL